MWNQTKNQWNSSNGQLHWFPIDFLWKWTIIDQNYANSNVFFSDWNFSEVSRVCQLKADVHGFLKILWFFYAMIFLNWSYGCSKLGPNWKTNFFERRRFFPFSMFAPRNNVRSLRLDNFEATGRAHSSFWRFLPIILNISKLASTLKFGVPGHSEVR